MALQVGESRLSRTTSTIYLDVMGDAMQCIFGYLNWILDYLNEPNDVIVNT